MPPDLPPPALCPKEPLLPWQFAQERLPPLEGELEDLPGVLRVLPELSKDPELRVPVEGELEDLPKL
jgi:hypothetical protein